MKIKRINNIEIHRTGFLVTPIGRTLKYQCRFKRRILEEFTTLEAATVWALKTKDFTKKENTMKTGKTPDGRKFMEIKLSARKKLVAQQCTYKGKTLWNVFHVAPIGVLTLNESTLTKAEAFKVLCACRNLYVELVERRTR